MWNWALVLTWVGVASSFTNPVIAVDAPDPGVIYVNGSFYVAVTSGNADDAFPIRRSQDLLNWELIAHVFPRDRKPAWTLSDYWAPEIHYVNGGYNVYYTATSRSGGLCVGVARGSSPTGPFQDRGSPLLTHPVGVIDPTFFRDEGKNYLIAKINGVYLGTTTPLNAYQLDENGLNIVSSNTTLIKRTFDWEGPGIEGPWVIKRGSFYYLFYSGQSFDSPWYSVGVARSTKLLGPYDKAPGPAFSQFLTNSHSSSRWAGPGHCSVITGVGPKQADYIVYHAWQKEHVKSAPGRLVLIDFIGWDAHDWPIIGDSNTPSSLPLPLPLAGEARTSQRVVIGQTYYFRSFQFPNSFWDYNGTIDGHDPFTVRGGLAGGIAVSLEANRPNYYFRHQNGVLVLSPYSTDPLFAADASFLPLSGLQDATCVSFRSVNYPDSFIRHQNGRLRIATDDLTDTFLQDASFYPLTK